MKRIMIVEDDERLNHGILLALRNSYFCIQAFSVESARENFLKQHLDLILLDINLPDGSGMDFLMEIREKSSIPILMLTGNKMEMDIVTGLELGDNDYITKPFSLMVLRARISVWFREEMSRSQVFSADGFFFDFSNMEFSRDGESIELSKTEQKLLLCLVENRGKNISRSRLIDQVWQGDTEFVEEHALTVAVNRLRCKLGDSSSAPEYIKTVYGIGYTWGNPLR